MMDGIFQQAEAFRGFFRALNFPETQIYDLTHDLFIKGNAKIYGLTKKECDTVTQALGFFGIDGEAAPATGDHFSLYLHVRPVILPAPLRVK